MMTQLALSDELAASISSAAAARNLSPEAFLASLVSQVEQDEDFAERILTPALQSRFIHAGEQAGEDSFVTEEEVDRKFAAFFQELESR